MKVILAKHFGVCFGVRDALQQAEESAQRGELTILGEMVHNPIAKERLAALGAIESSLDAPAAKTKQVMITAHGASDRAVAAWRDRGHEIIDGTCPLVRHAHEALRELVEQGDHPIVIGKRDHVEVRGLIGDFPDASVIEETPDIESLPSVSAFGVVAQTTQPIDRVRRLVDELKTNRPEAVVHFRDTVCQPTKNRQEALRALLSEVDAVVVVGGKNSNNTLQLLSTCRKAGTPSFHIERVEELTPSWFKGFETVGLTAGTSTIRETVEAVRAWLNRL
ncbi:MAG TPA: 4-hydroxy-3-methylbut-2-enyl diphosphate reductase [Chthoniobacterales bacterium]|jgi:4-hydroxy-3-methylbut-2-enyl diphosphate reductase|nr:4-hydroxy-3-methylbut-2-enyl diphosphate reductase [Chthoniobacterales bacterium]